MSISYHFMKSIPRSSNSAFLNTYQLITESLRLTKNLSTCVAQGLELPYNQLMLNFRSYDTYIYFPWLPVFDSLVLQSMYLAIYRNTSQHSDLYIISCMWPMWPISGIYNRTFEICLTKRFIHSVIYEILRVATFKNDAIHISQLCS